MKGSIFRTIPKEEFYDNMKRRSCGNIDMGIQTLMEWDRTRLAVNPNAKRYERGDR